MADVTRAKVLSYLENSNMLEISELIGEIEDKFGVTAAAPVAVAAAPAGGEAVVKEQTEFDVELTSIGDKKINVIKAVRELTQLGLKEAKGLVDGAPAIVKGALPKEEAEGMKSKLEEAGATVTLK